MSGKANVLQVIGIIHIYSNLFRLLGDGIRVEVWTVECNSDQKRLIELWNCGTEHVDTCINSYETRNVNAARMLDYSTLLGLTSADFFGFLKII